MFSVACFCVFRWRLLNVRVDTLGLDGVFVSDLLECTVEPFYIHCSFLFFLYLFQVEDFEVSVAGMGSLVWLTRKAVTEHHPLSNAPAPVSNAPTPGLYGTCFLLRFMFSVAFPSFFSG